MGRFKKLEIKGLIFKDFSETFFESLNKAVESDERSNDEIIKKLLPEMEGLFAKYEEITSSLYLENHKFKLESFLKSHFHNQKQIANSHKDSFEAFILYINGCYVIYEKIIEKLKRKRIDSTLITTISIYGLIIRRADKIINLLLCGYVDGAMIIWRSLYENAIVLLTLALENNNELADGYFKHSVRNSKKKLLSYKSNHKALKFPALSPSIEKKMESEVKIIEEKYGKDFLDNEFGWADCLFPGKQKASFRLLEEKVEMSRFRPFYLACSEHLHQSSSGLHNYMENNKIILSNFLRKSTELDNYIDPIQFTVDVLHEVNDYILYEFSTEDEYNVNTLLMRKIFEKQQKTFNKPKRKKTSK